MFWLLKIMIILFIFQNFVNNNRIDFDYNNYDYNDSDFYDDSSNHGDTDGIATINLNKYNGHSWNIMIIPGTKWCGAGNISKSYDDLGLFWKTDRCCREHDSCFDIMPGFKTKHKLVNYSPFTKLHCDCDEKFRQCLKLIDDPTSNKIGFIYFNLLRRKCFKYDYPIKSCKKRSRTFRCIDYDLDTTKNKTYQWFNVKNYKLL